MTRPHTTVVLAMSADGKIADEKRSPARFPSSADARHLEEQVALADGVIFGAGTLRTYGTTRSVSDPNLIQSRIQRQQSPQPIQMVVSASADLKPDLRFFSQSIPRWLLTTSEGAKQWREFPSKFETIIEVNASDSYLDWQSAFTQLTQLGLKRLAILGGGELVASLIQENLVDELWLTVCPIILGGKTAPTPVQGIGFSETQAQRLQLLSANTVEQEVFLHYRLLH